MCLDLPMRFWIAAVLFLYTFCNVMVRSSFSLSILRMVIHNEQSISKECNLSHHDKYRTSPISGSHEKHLDWTEITQSFTLGAYLFGYIPVAYFSGYILMFLGPWNTIFYTSVSVALLNAFIPSAAILSPWNVVFLRILIGILTAPEYPALCELISYWSPQNERGMFVSAIFGGAVGVVIAWVGVGILTYYLDWTYAFYMVSVVEFGFAMVFAFVVTDHPIQSNLVDSEELCYILDNQPPYASVLRNRRKNNIWPPYKKILKSTSFWVITIADFGKTWVFYTNVILLPKFLGNLLGFDIYYVGMYSSLPFLGFFVFLFVFGFIGDRIRAKNWLSLICIRKIAVVITHLLPAFCVFGLLLMHCSDLFKTLTLIFLAHICTAAIVIGHWQNMHDIAPNFTAAVTGVMISFSSIAAVSSLINGVILQNASDILLGYHIVFTIAGSVSILSSIPFLIYGKTDVEPWNEIGEVVTNVEY